MNIQEIFNRVIDQKYYDTSDDYSSMCHSLHYAWDFGEISEDEYLFAKEQIKEYLLPAYGAFLFTALKTVGLPHTIEARTAIYRDWANRPSISTT